MTAFLSILAGLISAVCYIPYIRDIKLGKTIPEKESWLLWSQLGIAAFFAQLAAGATWSLSLSGTQVIGINIVFFMSLRKGSGSISKYSFISIYTCFLAIIIWHFTKSELLAISIILFIDSVGVFLTLRKTYLDPESETLSTWVLAGIAGVITCVIVRNATLTLLIAPIYTVALNVLMVAIIIRRRSFLKDKAHPTGERLPL